MVDQNYQSKDDNFQAIQTIANDRQEKAFFAIVGPNDKFASQVGVKQGTGVIVKSFKDAFGEDNYVSKKSAILGQTLYPLRGSPLADVIYSTDNHTRVYVANDMTDIEIVATAYHELRAHVFLSNMGRDIPKGQHGYGGVDATSKAAETDARKNFKERPQQKKR